MFSSILKQFPFYTLRSNVPFFFIASQYSAGILGDIDTKWVKKQLLQNIESIQPSWQLHVQG